MPYTVQVTADSDGRNGRVRSSDGMIDLALGIPRELGGDGGKKSNPEQLFAAGYAGCFMSSLASVARQHKVKLFGSSVSAHVTIAGGEDGFNLSVRLQVDLPGVDSATANILFEGAHRRCPYSRAVRGNIPVTVELV
jgi:osmotically inducible protein OsmC